MCVLKGPGYKHKRPWSSLAAALLIQQGGREKTQ